MPLDNSVVGQQTKDGELEAVATWRRQ